MTIANLIRTALDAMAWAVNSEVVFGILAVATAFIFGGYLVRVIVNFVQRWRENE